MEVQGSTWKYMEAGMWHVSDCVEYVPCQRISHVVCLKSSIGDQCALRLTRAHHEKINGQCQVI